MYDNTHMHSVSLAPTGTQAITGVQLGSAEGVGPTARAEGVVGFGPVQSAFRGATRTVTSLAAAAALLGVLAGCQTAPQPRHLTLTWTAPTQYQDGTPLTSVPSYTVYYGNQSRALGAYPVRRDVGTPGCTTRAGETQCTYVWQDTSFGQNCFSVTATVPVNNESPYSGEACVTIAAPARRP